MRHLNLAASFLLLSFGAACGRQIVEFPANTIGSKGPPGTDGVGRAQDYPPFAAPISPVNGATDVSVSSVITVGFSKPMDSATITETTFTLKRGDTLIPGFVTYDEASKTATFHPTHALDPNERYTVMLTTGAEDAGGLALATDLTWTFTTAKSGAAPVVNATTPLDGAGAVLSDSRPTATFSKAMDPTTITFLTFTLEQGATQITGTVSFDSTTNIATFTPDAPLDFGRVYTATITTGAKDTANAPLVENHVWTFATAARPTVLFTSPLKLANNVTTGTKPTATFDKAMDGATITNLTFTLQKTVGLTAVTGAVTFDSATNTATFTPAAPLDLNASYTATITVGAKDIQTVALGTNHVWTFITAVCSPQAPVDLGFAAPFVALGGSAISNVAVAGTVITGNVGLAPNDQTSITGFGSWILNGTQFAASPPDPIATAAQAALTVASADAAGRTSACKETVTPLDLGGRTLLPNLYFSASTMAITGTLTLDGNGDDNAVFIFQMGSGFTTATDSQIILINGAHAKNIFWQVGSSATLGLRTAFHGTILAQTSITLNDGATLDGRALAAVAVSLHRNVIGKPTP